MVFREGNRYGGGIGWLGVYARSRYWMSLHCRRGLPVIWHGGRGSDGVYSVRCLELLLKWVAGVLWSVWVAGVSGSGEVLRMKSVI